MTTAHLRPSRSAQPGAQVAPSPWIIHPTPVVSPHDGPRRVPPRAPGDREPGYQDRYDDTTLFYDVFAVGRRILAIGPPAGSLVSEVRHTVVQGTRRVSPLRVEHDLDRVGRFWARLPRRTVGPRPSLSSELFGAREVGEDLSDHFRGRRAVMTVSKDNPLEWVADWGRWYTQRHGADALVVYDNGSTSYSLEDLWSTLAAVPGVVVAAVVSWPFRYGPIGRDPLHAETWDSNYAQHGAIEHARWRLLRAADAMLSVDIDEVVNDPDGVSVFDAVSRVPSGVLSIPGAWVYPDAGASDRRPEFTDHYWIAADPSMRDAPPKWCVVPGRLPRHAQLTTHLVRGVCADTIDGRYFWHLYGISTNWDGRRSSEVVAAHQYEIEAGLKARHDGLVNSRPSAGPGRVPWPARVRRLPRSAWTRLRHAVRRARQSLQARRTRARS